LWLEAACIKICVTQAIGQDSIIIEAITVQAIAIEVEATELRGKIVTDFVDALPGALIDIGNVVESTELVKSATAVVALAVLRHEVELEPLSVAGGSGFVGDIATGLVDAKESG